MLCDKTLLEIYIFRQFSTLAKRLVEITTNKTYAQIYLNLYF